jgi:hypothetical protein
MGASPPDYGSHYNLGSRPEDGLACTGGIKKFGSLRVLIGSPNEVHLTRTSRRLLHYTGDRRPVKRDRDAFVAAPWPRE